MVPYCSVTLKNPFVSVPVLSTHKAVIEPIFSIIVEPMNACMYVFIYLFMNVMYDMYVMYVCHVCMSCMYVCTSKYVYICITYTHNILYL